MIVAISVYYPICVYMSAHLDGQEQIALKVKSYGNDICEVVKYQILVGMKFTSRIYHNYIYNYFNYSLFFSYLPKL